MIVQQFAAIKLRVANAISITYFPKSKIDNVQNVSVRAANEKIIKNNTFIRAHIIFHAQLFWHEAISFYGIIKKKNYRDKK